MEKYLNYLSNITRRDKGRNIIIALSIIFLIVAYRLATGKLYEDIIRIYGNCSIFSNISEIIKVIYNSYDYILCFIILIIVTFWLKKSNDEWALQQYQKMCQEEERKVKEELEKEEKEKNKKLATINEENEEEFDDKN